jgi:hypothetical protein
MKLLAVILILGAAFYVVPGIVENVGSPCEAAIKRALTNDPPRASDGSVDRLASSMALMIGPGLFRKAAEERFPNVPPEVFCACHWWAELGGHNFISVSGTAT